MPLLEQLSFRSIPNQSRLFLDYVESVPGALAFYETPPELAAVEKAARTTIPSLAFDRERIASILHRQNRSYANDSAISHSIDELRHPDSVAVVTGQQVGLFGGPLYTFYKALATLRLAGDLRIRGVRAVPVFWMDSEDHDLAEITHVTLLPTGGTAKTVDFRPALYGEDRERPQPVGARRLPQTIAGALKEFVAALPQGDCKPAAAEALETAYRPGATYAEAFARLLTGLFRGRGLVLFDPNDPEAKQLTREVFVSALRGADDIHERLLERNGMLEQKGYRAQVALQEHSTVLFLNHDGERRAVTRHGDGFALKNSDARFARDELIGLATTAPERFSPNVLLRPIIQDSLFPTAAYVAGPAEIAYFAQIRVLYEYMRRPMPAIWPRASFTLLEPEVEEALQSHGLRVEDCFSEKIPLMRKMIEAGGHADSMSILNDLRSTVETAVAHLRPKVAAVDASLGPALDTATRKVSSHIDGLQARFTHVEASRNGELERVADFVLAHCRPNGNLQERELNVNYFLARFGPALVDEISALAGTGGFRHGVVRFGPPDPPPGM